MKAVIMAGGQGSRLRPLTCDLPKPMVPVLNLPIMEHIINLLKRHDITEIAVTTYYLPRKIEEYFGQGEKWGVEIKYFEEESPLGTAGSVHNASDFLDETFLVISGDALTDFDLQQGIDFHQQKNAEGTLLLSQEEVPLEYGVVMTDGDKRINRFLEKPNWGQVFSDTVNTGIYILEPNIFELYERGEKFDFSQDLFPLMLRKEKDLFGLPMEGYWNDIGNIEEYRESNFDFLSGQVNLPLPNYRKVQNNVWVEENVELGKNIEFSGPVLIGKDSCIGDNVYLERCLLGKNNILEGNSSLKDSILWDNIFLGQKSQLRETVIADRVKIRGEADIFDHTGIGKDSVLGKGITVKPGVNIWPEKEIEADTIIKDSIIHSPRWCRELFADLCVSGICNVDINPEFMAKLAAAYASGRDTGEEVVVGSDNYEVSSSLKRALIGGLQSAGINVIDMGVTITPVMRYGIYRLKAAGGINIKVDPHYPRKVNIEFMNELGANLSVDEQKNVEKKYFAEDFRRVNIKNLGDYSRAPGMNKTYLEEITKSLETEKIKASYFQLVVDYEYNNLVDLLPVFLKKLNCQIISTRNFSSRELPLSFQERIKIKNRMGQMVKENNYDFGIIVDHNAEQLNLVSEKGEVISGPEFQVLISYILLEKGITSLYLPVNAPRVIEKMADDYNTEINYTPVRPQYAMNEYLQKQGEKYRFYPYRDVIYSLGLILEKMADEGITYHQLINKLPEFYLEKTSVSCSSKDKGRVMRHLSEDTTEREKELIDGIKFNHQDGWVLVLPDSEAASFHVYAEADDAETAQELTGIYCERLKDLIEK